MGKKISDNRTNPAIKAAVKKLEEEGILTDEVRQELASIDFAVEDFFKEDGTPKRPMNSFLAYSQFRRGDIAKREECKGYSTGQISKVLSSGYRSQPDPECIAKAQTIRRIHRTLFSNYKYTRRPNGSKKKDKKGKGKEKALTRNDGVTPQFVQGSSTGVSNRSEPKDPRISLPAALEGGYGGAQFNCQPYPQYNLNLSLNGYYPNFTQAQGLQGYQSMHSLRDEHFTNVPDSTQYQPQNLGENVANSAPRSYYDFSDSITLDPNGIISTQNQGELTADHYYGNWGLIAPDQSAANSSQFRTQNQGVVTSENNEPENYYGSFSLEDFQEAHGFLGSVSPGPIAANEFGSLGSVSQTGPLATASTFIQQTQNEGAPAMINQPALYTVGYAEAGDPRLQSYDPTRKNDGLSVEDSDLEDESDLEYIDDD